MFEEIINLIEKSSEYKEIIENCGHAMFIGKKDLTIDITVPSRGFEKHLNTGITIQQVDVLTEQILNDLIDNFMESEIMGCTRYYSIRGGYGMNMDGVNTMNNIGSNIKINFVCRGDKFSEQVENYNSRLDEYINQQETGTKLKK